MGQTNRNSKNGCATRLNYKKVKYPQTLLLKVHYETSVPTVLDRFIQQAVMQVLQRRWDRKNLKEALRQVKANQGSAGVDRLREEVVTRTIATSTFAASERVNE